MKLFLLGREHSLDTRLVHGDGGSIPRITSLVELSSNGKKTGGTILLLTTKRQHQQ